MAPDNIFFDVKEPSRITVRPTSGDPADALMLISFRSELRRKTSTKEARRAVSCGDARFDLNSGSDGMARPVLCTSSGLTLTTEEAGQVFVGVAARSGPSTMEQGPQTPAAPSAMEPMPIPTTPQPLIAVPDLPFAGLNQNFVATCAPLGSSEPKPDPRRQVARTVTETATGATGGAINTAINQRNDSGGADVSRNTLFFAAPINENNGSRLWGNLQFRKFSGDTDGNGGEITFGIDTELPSGVIIGGILSYGDYDLEVDGTEVTARSLTLGPYFSVEVSDMWEIDGYLTYARPEYDVGGTDFTATRWSAQLRATATHMLGDIRADSFVSLLGYREDQPAAGTFAAQEVSSFGSSAGTKLTMTSLGNFQPYLSIGLDYREADDGTDGTGSHTSPRVGLGFKQQMDAGLFRLDLDGGRIDEGTRDMGISVGYEVRF